MQTFRNTWIAVASCAVLSVGTFLVPWGLAALSQWAPDEGGSVVEKEPTRVVYWEAEPEPEPEPVPLEVEPEAVVADTVAEPEVVEPVPVPGEAPEPAVSPEVQLANVGTPVAKVKRQKARMARVAARRARARKARLRRLRQRRKCAKPHPSVRTAQDGTVEVERAYVDAVTKNLKVFMELGYSRPHAEEGIKGWYISGFGCTSPVHKAGFRRRDILLTVNGKKTRSWAGVFLLYQRLKRKTEFEVQLLRKGEARTLQFRIVEDWATTG